MLSAASQMRLEPNGWGRAQKREGAGVRYLARTPACLVLGKFRVLWKHLLGMVRSRLKLAFKMLSGSERTLGKLFGLISQTVN